MSRCRCSDCCRSTPTRLYPTTDAGYRVVRMYFHKPGQRRTIIDRCTLAEAQAHCASPDTSSSTATSSSAKACTQRNGPWFDGYEER